jgi:hypothetical protein
MLTLILGAVLFAAPLGGAAADPPAHAAPASPSWDGQLDFTLSPAGHAGERARRVNLSLRYGDARRSSQHSRTMDFADLAGVTPSELSDNAPVRFRLAREAGTVDCTGTARGEGRAAGNCRFVPDEGFAADLDRRGIGRPRAEDQFHLAMAGVGRPLLDELARQGYQRPRVSDLVGLGIHGADVEYLRELDAAGYRVGSLDKLVAFRIHGVTPAYIGELAALGGAFRNMAADDLVAMRIHGVTPAFAREMASLGYSGLRPNDLVSMRIHGVTPAYVREMAAAGYPDLTAEQLLNLRIHGVRADDARALNAAVAGRAR